jgi:zinc protease
MEDVKEFFAKYYVPNNAYLVVAGDVTYEQVKRLAKKWFAPIPKGEVVVKNFPKEPRQTQARFLELQANVPANALYKTYHTCNRTSLQYTPTDLLSDLLGRGKSSRLYQKLVQEQKMFSSISAYVTGAADDGLLVIAGKVYDEIALEDADKAITEIVETFRKEKPEESELQKVKNQAESTLVFGEMELQNRAFALAYAAFLGNVDFVNDELKKLQDTIPAHIQTIAHEVLKPENCSTMYYRAKK